jgi:glycerol kinase
VAEMWREASRYEPRMDEAERERLVGRWRQAVERAKGWAPAEAAPAGPDPNA